MTASVQYKFGGVVASAEDAYAVASKYKTPTVSGRPSIGSIMAQRVPPGSSTIPVVPSPASRDFEGLTSPTTTTLPLRGPWDRSQCLIWFPALDLESISVP